MTTTDEQTKVAIEGRLHAFGFRPDGPMTFGFRPDDLGQYIAEGCRVTLCQVGEEWELDIRLPNGSAIGCDVPAEALSGRTAEEIAARKAAKEDGDGMG